MVLPDVEPLPLAAFDRSKPIFEIDYKDAIVRHNDDVYFAARAGRSGQIKVRVGKPVGRKRGEGFDALDLALMYAVPAIDDFQVAPQS